MLPRIIECTGVRLCEAAQRIISKEKLKRRQQFNIYGIFHEEFSTDIIFQINT